MGSYLSGIQSGQNLQTNCPLVNLSLAKIRELHGGFKSICDSFAINLTDFENIFQSGQATFNIFDTDKNGFIDAHEILSGLVMFSDSKAEEKIRFLFDLYDFNESQSISVMDLEFMLQCILECTSKIFSLDIEINELEVVALVTKNFHENSQISLPQLLVWTSKCEEVQMFFLKFMLDPPKMISSKVLHDREFQIIKAVLEKAPYTFPPVYNSKFIAKSQSDLVNSKRAQNFRAWLNTAMQPIIAYRLEQVSLNDYRRVPEELVIQMEWVYGIRCQDTKKTLQYTVGRQIADSVYKPSEKFEDKLKEQSEEVIYFVSNTIILLNIHLNRQRFYTQHGNEVASLAVSNKNGDLIASGEMCMIKPCVHIWNSRTLENMAQLQGIHDKGIHLLAFTNNDEFLVTCGMLEQSPIVIYNWQTSQVVVSTSLSSPSMDISIFRGVESAKLINGIEEAEKPEHKSIVEGFSVLSQDSLVMYVYAPEQKEFKVNILPLRLGGHASIEQANCALALLADYRSPYYSKTGLNHDRIIDIDHTLKHIVLTGHKDGAVLVWRLQEFIGLLVQYPFEVTAMTKCYSGVAIGLASGQILIWNETLQDCTDQIDLTALPCRVMSPFITSLDHCQKRLLVLTKSGDSLQIALGDGKNKAQRINQIIRLPGSQQRAMTILSKKESTIMFGGNAGLVCSFDLASHDLIDVWEIGRPVSALGCLSLDDGNFVMAAGTENGHIIIRQDWEDFVPKENPCGSKPLIDIKFARNGRLIAAASIDRNIYILQFQDGDYVPLTACQLENGYPVSINFSEDSSKIVINTNLRKLLVLESKSLNLRYRPEDLSTSFWSSYQSKFPINQKSMTAAQMPIVLGNLTNFVASGDENGNLFVWKDVESIKENIGTNFQIHTCPIQKVELTVDDKRIITLGYEDNSICQFTNSEIFTSDDPVSQAAIREAQQKIDLHPEQDETLILELNYCFQIQTRKTDHIQDQTALVRGCSNMTVNRLMSKLNFDQEETSWRRAPQISLVLENIYGILVADKRHTVYYLHFYSKHDQDRADRLKASKTVSATDVLHLGKSAEKKLDYILPKILGQDFKTLLKQEEAIEYDPAHVTCQKKVLYFTSRFGVVYDAAKNIQTFYQGHKLKISALAKHPYLRLVATGEVNLFPQIHIWDSQTMENQIMLQTSHKGGVLHLLFSPDGQKILSIGMDRAFSIQVFIWRQKRSLAFRNTGYNPIFGVKFNPFDDSQFFTCGYQHIGEWRLTGSHLTCVKYITILPKPLMTPRGSMEQDDKTGSKKIIMTCMDFISFRLGHAMQSDIILGNNLGDISTYCSKKHFVINEQAHPGVPINAIKVTNLLYLDMKTAMVITAGEDGMIKIWDASLQIKQQIDVRQAVEIQDLKNIRSYGVQSIDLYGCDRKSPSSFAPVRLLAGMRSGDVIEIELDFNKSFKSADEIMMSQNMTEEQKAVELQKLRYQQEFKQKFGVTFNSLISCHSSLQISHQQKKIITCLHPTGAILASVGNDETLMIWDVSKCTCIISRNLGTQATCLDFSPDGFFLCVGLVNGVFMLLESKMDKVSYGTYTEDYSKPSLSVVMCPKQSRSAIIKVKFSFRGDFLAVSYNNEFKLSDQLNEAEVADKDRPLTKKEKEAQKGDPAFVLLYVNRLSPKNPGNIISNDPYVKFQKLEVPNQQLKNQNNLKSKMAVTTFDFSDCDRYLEMASQLIDKDNNVTIDSTEDEFLVWDVQTAKFVSDFNQFKLTEWPDWSLCSSLNARYVNQKVERGTDEEEHKLLPLETMSITNVARFTLYQNAVIGTNFGEIFAFRFGSIFIDKNRVYDFKFDRIPKKEMALTKGFDALTSMISSLSIFEDRKVFVTGSNDQCILQYKVEYEDQRWEMDFNTFIADVPDPFKELPNKYFYISEHRYNWGRRLELPAILQKIDMEEFQNPVCDMELEHVIGRRAFDRRNNVKIDSLNRIVYNASSLMVFMQDNLDPDATSYVKQTYIHPDKDKFDSQGDEVSCFTLSEDKRLLFIGTSGIKASLMVWEVPTGIQLAKKEFHQLSLFYSIKVAFDNSHLVLIGVTEEYVPTILLYEYVTDSLLCQKLFMHSLTFKIKDCEFIPGYTRRFVTCGIQHMQYWKFNGQSLEHTVGEMTVPKVYSTGGHKFYNPDPDTQGKLGLDLVTQGSVKKEEAFALKEQDPGLFGQKQFNQLEEELETVFATFLNIVFLHDSLISSADDGCLYMWAHNRIVRKVYAHEGAVLALDANQTSGFIVSGGMEGVAIMWRLQVEPNSNIKSLDKLRVFNLRPFIETPDAIQMPEYQIQSVCLGFNRVVMGTRSGSIFEMQISDDGNPIIRQRQDPKTKIRHWIKSLDNQKPISVGIDATSQRFFALTQEGLLSAWDILTLNISYQRHFYKISRKLVLFQTARILIIVYEHDFAFYKCTETGDYIEIQEYNQALKKLDLEMEDIKDLKLSSNEKMMAVAYKKRQFYSVAIFNLGEDIILEADVQNNNAYQYIDFSTDGSYLQCVDIMGHTNIFEIESKNVIHPEMLNFELEWLSDGLRQFIPLENIIRNYSDDNRITAIAKLPGKPIIVIGDEVGTLRMYNYPNTGSDLYYQCSSDHMNYISNAVFSPNQRFLITMGKVDRCIMKWKLSYDNDRIKQLMNY